jgi:hypothetical protein
MQIKGKADKWKREKIVESLCRAPDKMFFTNQTSHAVDMNAQAAVKPKLYRGVTPPAVAAHSRRLRLLAIKIYPASWYTRCVSTTMSPPHSVFLLNKTLAGVAPWAR